MTAAEANQWAAARDLSPKVRLLAGPGTGKTYTIEKRVEVLLQSGAVPSDVYVISFTRAACEELKGRIQKYLAAGPYAAQAQAIRVSTLHALALRVLRSQNLLAHYPGEPMMLDAWEQKNIYDAELAASIGCTPTRAAEIRYAHDSEWQTLNPSWINQSQITQTEKTGFNAFHATRTNLYSCILPGEVVYKCVEALRLGAVQSSNLPTVEHLVVDEFQDLNECDQTLIEFLVNSGATLFVAGDDDQSIYSFRHANPNGLINFSTRYHGATSHTLTECFRCAPAIVTPANALISHNHGRLPKTLVPLYGNANPAVQGILHVWSFANAQAEAVAIAASCQSLIQAGMSGREDDIVILISNQRLQLPTVAQELGNLGLAYEPPKGESLTSEDGVRAIYCLLRIATDISSGDEDYPAHRGLLHCLSGVGVQTARTVSDLCVANNQNFRALFHSQIQPTWLTGRNASAVGRVSSAISALSTLNLQTDTLGTTTAVLTGILSNHIFVSGNNSAGHVASWTAVASSLPQYMTLEEVLDYLSASSESEQEEILNQVNLRSSGGVSTQPPAGPKKIRILTMHGAKGLSGKVVFIPSAEDGIMPSSRAIQATGLLIEHRRLFYVSLTRAKAACIVSHASLHTGPSAFLLQQQPNVRLPRSRFLNEMAVASMNRAHGLNATEATQILNEVNNL